MARHAGGIERGIGRGIELWSELAGAVARRGRRAGDARAVRSCPERP